MTALEFKNTIIPAYRAMLAVSMRLLVKEEAEDIVQDVLQTLWEKHDQISLKCNPAAFAIKCVRNRCLDVIRNQKHQNSFESLNINFEDEHEQDIEFTDKINQLSDAINRLKEPAKTIILLNLKGKSGAKIAAETGFSEANIRQILSRTRRNLKTLFLKNA